MGALGRRGFLGMFAAAAGAAGLDLLPGVAQVVRAVETAHVRATRVILRRIGIQGSFARFATAAHALGGDLAKGRHLANGSVAPWDGEVFVSFPDGLVLGEGDAIEVLTRASGGEVFGRTLVARNLRGRLTTDVTVGRGVDF